LDFKQKTPKPTSPFAASERSGGGKEIMFYSGNNKSLKRSGIREKDRSRDWCKTTFITIYK
jgi:hypothetical protein